MTPGSAAALSGVPVDKGRTRVGGAQHVAAGRRVDRPRADGRDHGPRAPGSLRPEAFVHALSVALVVAAVIAFAGAIVAVTRIRSHAGEPRAASRRPRPRRPAAVTSRPDDPFRRGCRPVV